MTRGPRVAAMVRIAFIVLLGVALSACGAPVREGGDPPAADVKKEVDAVARTVLPPLTESLGVTPTGLQATFTERAGFGLWDYRAGGQFVGPQGGRDELMSKVETVLRASGLDVERDDTRGDVRGTSGNATVLLTATTARVAGTNQRQNLVEVTIGSTDPTSEGDEFAETAEPEDYLAYVE